MKPGQKSASPFYLESSATLSPCWRYRYTLHRRWALGGGGVTFIGLNPSTADARLDDPTIRRCVGFAKAWGFNAVDMINLFAFRATSPDDMLAQEDPEGPDNDDWILDTVANAGLVVAAWGTSGHHRRRDRRVCELLDSVDLHVLRITKDGHPAHPLYLPGALRPAPWRTARPHGDTA